MGRTEIVLIALISVAVIGLFNMKANNQPHEDLMFEIWKGKMNKQYDEK